MKNDVYNVKIGPLLREQEHKEVFGPKQLIESSAQTDRRTKNLKWSFY